MLVSIHQPSYLPWIGFIHKIYFSDIFVFHDDVQFSKKSMYRRAYIRKNNNAKGYLIIPLKKHSDFELISNLALSHDGRWQKHHINSIYDSYHKCPYYKEYSQEVNNMILNSYNYSTFSEYSINTIKRICYLLNITTPLYASSKLPVKGYKTNYNINIIKYFKGDKYLSGSGACKSYQKDIDFTIEGISIIKQEIYSFIDEHQYDQHNNKFINGLSIIDLLFNIGPEGIRSILEKYSQRLFANEIEN